MSKYKYTKEEMQIVISDSLSISDVCKKLKIKPCGGNYKTIKSKIKKWEFNIQHFTGSGWNQGIKFKKFNKEYPLEEILVKNSSYTNSHRLKTRLINAGIKTRICEKCKLKEWNNLPIPIELNHINGDNTDNRLENLEIVCPNCHAQTENYCSKNSKSYLLKKKLKCIECNEPVKTKSKSCLCSNCARKKQRKINRPSLSILESEIKEIGYSATGRKYGVSDNSIRKWIEQYKT